MIINFISSRTKRKNNMKAKGERIYVSDLKLGDRFTFDNPIYYAATHNKDFSSSHCLIPIHETPNCNDEEFPTVSNFAEYVKGDVLTVIKINRASIVCKTQRLCIGWKQNGRKPNVKKITINCKFRFPLSLNEAKLVIKWQLYDLSGSMN